MIVQNFFKETDAINLNEMSLPNLIELWKTKQMELKKLSQTNVGLIALRGFQRRPLFDDNRIIQSAIDINKVSSLLSKIEKKMKDTFDYNPKNISENVDIQSFLQGLK